MALDASVDAQDYSGVDPLVAAARHARVQANAVAANLAEIERSTYAQIAAMQQNLIEAREAVDRAEAEAIEREAQVPDGMDN